MNEDFLGFILVAGVAAIIGIEIYRSHKTGTSFFSRIFKGR